jgi:hypothetical protein
MRKLLPSEVAGSRVAQQLASPLKRRSDGYTEKCCAANEEAGEVCMDQTEFLLEYLKEQYAQARQHETRQTNATTFLTAAAAAILALAFKDGTPRKEMWWVGIVVVLIGAANLAINQAHYRGNRYHTTVAGKTRKALEKAITAWTVDKPTKIRTDALAEFQSKKKPDPSIGETVHRALTFVPVGIALVGAAVVVFLLSWGRP